ncbi:MAG: M48 family metallopeptidase [Thermoanaerobaculia bacterium]
MISKEEFKNEVKIIAKKIGVNPKEVHLRKMKRKIASCSSKGRITFSIEILKEIRQFRYHTIIHELLHLRYPNHSKMFNIMLKYYEKNMRKSLKASIES